MRATKTKGAKAPLRSEGEQLFWDQVKREKLPKPEEQYFFHPFRKWRFDFAWPKLMIALEVEGGTFRGGRHTRGKGFENDCIKYNEATAMGWTVLRATTSMVRKELAIWFFTRTMEQNKEPGIYEKKKRKPRKKPVARTITRRKRHKS